MARDRVSVITHGDLPFHDPLDVARIDEAYSSQRTLVPPRAR
jgi:hypothetical protein